MTTDIEEIDPEKPPTFKQKLILDALDNTDLGVLEIAKALGVSSEYVGQVGALDGINLLERTRHIELDKRIKFLEDALTRARAEKILLNS